MIRELGTKQKIKDSGTTNARTVEIRLFVDTTQKHPFRVQNEYQVYCFPTLKAAQKAFERI